MSRQRSASTLSSAAAPATLPEYLARWASHRARAVALRHKVHGSWRAWTWGDLQAEVARVAAALGARGFERGEVVAVASDLSPQALALALAAQGLGGAALWVEPEAVGQPEGGAGRSEAIAPGGSPVRFGLARDEAGLVALRARVGAGPWTLGLLTAEHGSSHQEEDDAESAVRAYAAVAAGVEVGAALRSGRLRAHAGDPAFFFPAAATVGGDRSSAAASLTQAASIAGARAWIEAEAVGVRGVAFAWEGPTTAAAATLLAGWLVAGFTLCLPEDATTVDADRREAQPTMV